MMGDIFSYLYQFADVFAFLILSAAGLAIVFGMMGIITPRMQKAISASIG